MPALRRRHCRDWHLVPPRREHRPAVMVAEQAIRGPLHMHDVIGMGADTAEQAEAGLDEQWRFDQAFGPEIVEIVEMARIVAFEFVSRAGLVEGFQRVSDILE